MVQSKIVKIIIPILFILLGLLVGIFFLQNQGKEKIELRYAPSIATVTIDDKEYKNGTVYLKQGKHIFKAELEGFKTESFDFDTDTKELGVALKPSNETGYKLLRDNIEYQKEIEEIGGLVSYTNGQLKLEKYPFISKLNLDNGSIYTIGYGVPSSSNTAKNAIALYVQAKGKPERELALYNINSQLGINPSDVEIIFEDFTNPFAIKENQ